MLGEACASLELESRGIVGDRAFAVCTADGKLGSGKSTRRFRAIEGLFGFRATADGIRFPDGRHFSFDDPTLDAALSEVLCQPVALRREGEIPHLDAAPLHLVTTGSLRAIGEDERRFRPNIVIDIDATDEALLGKIFRIGSAVIRVVEPTERCVMVTLGQDDLPRNPRLLERIGPCFGVYAEVPQAGRIALGDRVSSL